MSNVNYEDNTGSRADDGDTYCVESQYDPGRFRIRIGGAGLEIGLISTYNGVEYWGMASKAGVQPNQTEYVPPGPSADGVFYSNFEGPGVPPAQLTNYINYPFHRIDVQITVDPNVETTGPGGGEPTKAFLFHEGQYELIQASKKVGDLMVGHVDGLNRHQYWFLYQKKSPTTGVYLTPGAVNVDVTTTIHYVGPYPANHSLNAFRANLPVHQFLLGLEKYDSTQP